MKITSAPISKSGNAESFSKRVGQAFRPGPVKDFLGAAYREFLMAGTGWRGLPYVLPDGESFRVLPAYRFASVNKEEFRAFKQAVKPGSVVLDIGANVGAYSMVFGMLAGQTGKVFSFEPSPETFAALVRHVELNHLKEIVFPQQYAVSDQKGTMHFLADRFHGTNRLACSGERADGPLSKTVETVTVDDFCALNGIRPDVIKIDIEGFECSALKGARNTIKERGAALSLFVEMHPGTWRTIGITRADVQGEIESQGWMALPLGDEVPWETEGVCMRLVPKT